MTELDKHLVDGLADPLIHIIQNSVDHGIEPQASTTWFRPCFFAVYRAESAS